MVDFFLMQNINYYFYSIQAPLVQPITEPRIANSCGDTVFPKTLSICDPPNIQHLEHEWSDLDITHSEASKLEKLSRNQSEDQKWHEERKKRITASNFGIVMKRKKDVNTTFLKNTFRKNEFSSSSTSYGKANENVAKQIYIKKTGNHLHDIGLIVNPSLPFLGATPDGITCEQSVTGIIEVKCPYSVRDMSINDACETRQDFFLQKDGDLFHLKHDHAHWYQVQGQLLVSGAPFCDFITYTKQDFYVARIFPHAPTMNDLIKKLSLFYVQHFKPFVHNYRMKCR